jgi:uncharacterized protein (TIGR00304 family)
VPITTAARALRVLAVACAIAALACGAVAIQRGELHVALFFVVPVFYGSGGWAFATVTAVFAAFALWFASGAIASEREVGWDHGPDPRGDSVAGSPGWSARQAESMPVEKSTRERTRGAGVVLVGPIPIIWGSDRRATIAAIVGALLLMAAFLLFWYAEQGRI